MKETVSIRLVTDVALLPDMLCHDFFHSTDFFKTLKSSAKMDPCMALAIDGQGNVVAHLLTIISYHRSLIPPMLYMHARIYGDGEYAPIISKDKEAIFRMMIEAIAHKFSIRMCMYIEISDLSNKLFGYEVLKACGFFPVQWQEIHNSLHSASPQARLTSKMRHEIIEAEQRGITSHVIETNSEELKKAYRLLKAYHRFKLRRFVPPFAAIDAMVNLGVCNVFVTTLGKHIIGTCVCIYSQGNAYMWIMASRRKTFLPYHPDTYTIWTALKYAHAKGYAHMYFMDVGMPFGRNTTREFLLGFGGKPVSKYRWFKTPFTIVNGVLDWCLNE